MDHLRKCLIINGSYFILTLLYELIEGAGVTPGLWEGDHPRIGRWVKHEAGYCPLLSLANGIGRSLEWWPQYSGKVL